MNAPEKPTDGRPWSSSGRLLGVDFGTVRVGLAVCDPDRIIASPLETFARPLSPGSAVPGHSEASFYRSVVERERIVGFVVGLPLHTGGEEGIKAKEARDYGAWLAAATGLPVAFWDERCTSAAAQDALIGAGVTKGKRKGRIDRVAAQIILQGFLDAGSPQLATSR